MTQLKIAKDNLENNFQATDAAHTVANVLVEKGFDGSLGSFWLSAECAYTFLPEYDKRTKVGKEFASAQKELFVAMGRYDLARKALKSSKDRQ